MRLWPVVKVLSLSLVVVAAAVGGIYYYAVTPHKSSAPADSAQFILDEADTLSWGNLWVKAQPLYQKAERMFVAEGQLSKALYARVSQIPPNESADLPSMIAGLTQDLNLPEASDPETRLRILTIRGMLETNFNASEAPLTTWQEVGTLATSLHHFSTAPESSPDSSVDCLSLG